MGQFLCRRFLEAIGSEPIASLMVALSMARLPEAILVRCDLCLLDSPELIRFGSKRYGTCSTPSEPQRRATAPQDSVLVFVGGERN